MKKDSFLLLLTNRDSLTADESARLASLQDEFPYSQAIHNLVARGSQLNNLATKKTSLNVAAVYATDRAVLKAIVSAPAAVRQEPVTKPKAEIKVEVKAPVKGEIKEEQPLTSKDNTEFHPSDLSGDELLNELLHDLDRLKVLKHNFEVAADAFDNQLHHPLATTKDEAPIKVSKKSVDAPRGIIDEIKSTKKKIKPSDPKQKEQFDIIDRFIKSKPSISKNKSATTPVDTTDLSENNSVFSDNIVSETLVEILIKQGKKEKAVEVLKKLIWKFPQKKAYFAAQIEELTS